MKYLSNCSLILAESTSPRSTFRISYASFNVLNDREAASRRTEEECLSVWSLDKGDAQCATKGRATAAITAACWDPHSADRLLSCSGFAAADFLNAVPMHRTFQMQHRDFRKPLICINPKSLLRLPACASSLEEFYRPAGFLRVLPEVRSDLVPDDQVRRVILCAGRVYYDIAAERQSRGINDVAIARIEQICPFPYVAPGNSGGKAGGGGSAG